MNDKFDVVFIKVLSQDLLWSSMKTIHQSKNENVKISDGNVRGNNDQTIEISRYFSTQKGASWKEQGAIIKGIVHNELTTEVKEAGLKQVQPNKKAKHAREIRRKRVIRK